LCRADLLAALGELVTFENGDLMSALLDNHFIALNHSVLDVDLRDLLRSQRAQLFGSHLVWIGQGSHVVDFIKAARLLQLKSKKQSLKKCYCVISTDSLPGQSRYQRLSASLVYR
jgi:hypothetical protein